MTFDWDSVLDQALEEHKKQNFGQAEAGYHRVLKVNPNCAEALHLLGVLSWQTQRLDFALECITKAIALNNSQPSWFLNLANVHFALKQFDDAETAYRKSLALDGSYASGHNNLGMALQKQGRFEEALQSYQKAIELKPNYADAYNHLGVTLRELGRFDEAYKAYTEVITLDPNNPHFYCNMGIAYFSGGNQHQAQACFEKAIKLDPESVVAHSSLGMSLHAQGKVDLGINSYRQVLKLNPKDTGALNCIYRDLQQRCSWNELEELGEQLDACTDELIEAGQSTKETPFLSIRRSQDPKRNLRVAKAWSEFIVSHKRKRDDLFQFENAPRNKSPLKIGYLSGSFGDNPVAHLIRRLFEVHDRDNFHCTMYSYDKNEASPYLQELKSQSDAFRSLKGVDDFSAAQSIAEDQIDILVDLMGHSQDNRLAICSLRPAPIQVTYLGFPGSVGSSMFDYILTDERLTPPEYASDYTENFVYLPHCYQINNDRLEMASGTVSRESEGLPSEGFVFCSFNRPYKISEALFDRWMSILQRVEGAVLWLLDEKNDVNAILKEQAELRGVDPQRLIFAPRTSLDKHLRRLKLASLALDTLNYSGGITTSHTLWAGVPVLTVPGKTYVSRMSYSLLSSMGLDELAVNDWQSYEDYAVHLATETDELKAIRQKLATNKETSPLFDSTRTCRNIERGYRLMWERYVNAEPPALIRVREA